jgi:hypothetical protein
MLRLKGFEPELALVVVNAEIRSGDTPDPRKLEEALEIYFAFQDDPVGMLRRSS